MHATSNPLWHFHSWQRLGHAAFTHCSLLTQATHFAHSGRPILCLYRRVTWLALSRLGRQAAVDNNPGDTMEIYQVGGTIPLPDQGLIACPTITEAL